MVAMGSPDHSLHVCVYADGMTFVWNLWPCFESSQFATSTTTLFCFLRSVFWKGNFWSSTRCLFPSFLFRVHIARRPCVDVGCASQVIYTLRATHKRTNVMCCAMCCMLWDATSIRCLCYTTTTTTMTTTIVLLVSLIHADAVIHLYSPPSFSLPIILIFALIFLPPSFVSNL